MTTISEGPDAAIEASPAPPATEACPAEQPVCQSTKPSLNAAAEMRDPSWFDPANGAKVGYSFDFVSRISRPCACATLPGILHADIKISAPHLSEEVASDVGADCRGCSPHL